MSHYEIEWTIPYEGVQKVTTETLQEVVDWIRSNKVSYEWSYDNLTVRGDLGEVNVYDLMRRADAGEPLTPPSLVEVEFYVGRLLYDVSHQTVGVETLAALDRLRDLITGLAMENKTEVPAPSGR